MSAQLKRLREAFQDEILAQQGKKMVPTPYALAMHPEITETIASLRALIARKGKFDPATSEREFKIVASDYITTVLLVPLLGAISTIAPFVKLDIALPYSNTNKSLADGELDMFLGPETFTHPDHPSELIFEERHVVVGWSGNPHMNEQMTIKRLSELGHVGVSISGGDTYIDAWNGWLNHWQGDCHCALRNFPSRFHPCAKCFSFTRHAKRIQVSPGCGSRSKAWPRSGSGNGGQHRVEKSRSVRASFMSKENSDPDQRERRLFGTQRSFREL